MNELVLLFSLLGFSPAVEKQMEKLYEKGATSFVTSYVREEYAFVVDSNGQPKEITSDHETRTNKVRIVTGDIAIFHTHPAGTNPKPSDMDIAGAKKAGVPVYTLSQRELYVALPSGKVLRIGSVEPRKNRLVITR